MTLRTHIFNLFRLDRYALPVAYMFLFGLHVRVTSQGRLAIYQRANRSCGVKCQAVRSILKFFTCPLLRSW